SAIDDEVLAFESATRGIDAVLGEVEEGGDLAAAVEREPVLVSDSQQEEVEERLGSSQSREEPVAHEAPIDPAEPAWWKDAPARGDDEPLLDAGRSWCSFGSPS